MNTTTIKWCDSCVFVKGKARQCSGCIFDVNAAIRRRNNWKIKPSLKKELNK